MKRLRNITRVLVDRQMRVWGEDAVHPEGSLLLRHGFERRRLEGVSGSRVYSCRWRDRRIEFHSQWAGLCGGNRPGIVYVRPIRSLRIVPENLGDAHLTAFGHTPIPTNASVAELQCVQEALLEFLEWIDLHEGWAAPRRRRPASVSAPFPFSEADLRQDAGFAGPPHPATASRRT